MRLKEIRVKNFRSIVDSGVVRIEPLQALVGENNCGKSNLIRSIQVFLSSGVGGVHRDDFFDPGRSIIITASFSDLTMSERRMLRPYLKSGDLILEKHIQLEQDDRTGRTSPKPEYHGYVAEPKDWWLSVTGVINHEKSERPNWRNIAEEHQILEYVLNDAGKVNKKSYEIGIRQILNEKDDIEFNEPLLGVPEALSYGNRKVLLENLPLFRLLPAITDYSHEVDKRTSTSNFRLLMGDLAERILIHDPRYNQIERNLAQLSQLLNSPREDQEQREGLDRLEIFDAVEIKLRNLISQLMPTVQGIRLTVELEAPRDIFSKGVSILVDDGKLTDVLMKGHGLQRCVVFGILQALIQSQRGQLIELPEGEIADEPEYRPMILGIEEPELYIHPQMQRLIYRVLREFTKTDQVLYSTHSPAFVDVAIYECIASVRKNSVEEGTLIYQCESGVLDASSERKTFQFVSSFGLEQNQMFFANRVVLVEGEEDIIALMATARHLGLFIEFPEEKGFTLIATGSKQEMPKYMKLLYGFKIPFVILHELDDDPDSDINKEIDNLLHGNSSVRLANRLEDVVGHEGHFNKKYNAMKFFEDSTNISEDFVKVTRDIFR